MATSEYDDHIAVTEVPTGDPTARTFDARLDAGWVVGGGVNGGYLLSTMGNAVRATVPGKPDPISVTAYYLSASTPGPARITTTVKRDGGSVATVAAELWQSEQSRLTALATYGDLSALPDGVETTAEEPDLPPRDRCVPNSMAPDDVKRLAPMMERFDMLFHPDHIGWAVGEPSGRGVISAWFRLKHGREPDPISLLTIVDLLPPVTFDLGRPGWAPTLELTAHVRARPAEGWLKVRHATRNVAGGMFEEDCEVWDSAGRLVAQSRQLARLPRS
ncbi:Thioesterase-like superfamily protein [Nocardioides terrae]|uniref:Thioesterase-like superfamily protein n=1 Tax=Nocardioides terrae TaxID=574651 RepID=A0A1I1DY91_9ACTN|nr:thioesterase family protein [Nocardioides terrae]SFB77680.1 Thioesterase-like superfamily protein [Nocardioides terrae]